MRYTDEGETNELCKWTVDLSSLPTFRQNASMPQVSGFYTGRLTLLAVLARHLIRLLKKNLSLGLSWTVPKSVEFSSTIIRNGEGMPRVISTVMSELTTFFAPYSRVTFDFLG